MKAATDEVVSRPAGSKELGPQEEAQTLDTIVKSSAEADRRLEEDAQAHLKEIRGFQESKEARLATAEPQIRGDLAGHMKSPHEDAEAIIKHGTTLELAISESEYKEDLKARVGGRNVGKTVVGVLSKIGLVTFFGRVIKLVQQKMWKIVFRGKEGVS